MKTLSLIDAEIPKPASFMGIAEDYAEELATELSKGQGALQLSLVAHYQRQEILEALSEISKASNFEQLKLSSEEFKALVDRNLGRLNLHNLTDLNRQLESQFSRKTIQTVQPWLEDSRVAKQIAESSFTNVSKIKTISSEYFDEIEKIVRTGWQEGLTAEQVGKEMSSRLGVKESRAKFIARNEMGNLNSNLSRVRQTNLGVESYIWSTSADERVRFTHAIKDQQKFFWNSPPADTGHAGMDYNCRCVAEPVFPDLDDLIIEEDQSD
jgi:SPP1 gp7 family putative phage head morphogenesis protein